MLLAAIDMLEDCADGPLGDFAAECLEELLETHEDGDDLRLLNIAGTMYSRRRHFRRAQELFARIEALQRGETRARVEKRRHIGEPLLNTTLHVDPAVDEYILSLPKSIVGSMKRKNHDLKGTDVGTSGLTKTSLTWANAEQYGVSGTYGDPLDDTWRGNLLRPGIQIPMHGAVASSERKESLVIPTTVGRSEDERAQPLLRSVAVRGGKVGATGGAQLLRRLLPGDLHRGTQSNTTWNADLGVQRRRGGHEEMWHKHLGHSPNLNISPQARILGNVVGGQRGDGGRAPWQGLPVRHWMEPRRSEVKTHNDMLEAADVIAEGAPAESTLKIANRRSSTEQSRVESATRLAYKFGSKQAEKDRILHKSREFVLGLPAPERKILCLRQVSGIFQHQGVVVWHGILDGYTNT